MHLPNVGSALCSVCPRCWSKCRLTQTRLSHHVDWRGMGLNICNRGLQRISPPRMLLPLLLLLQPLLDLANADSAGKLPLRSEPSTQALAQIKDEKVVIG